MIPRMLHRCVRLVHDSQRSLVCVLTYARARTPQTLQVFVLSPGGGLEAHVRKDTTQAAAAASEQSWDRVLVLSNMDVDEAALQLLMEAALAGLKQAAAPSTAEDDDKSNSKQASNETESEQADLNTSKKLAKSLETASKSIESLAASTLKAHGEQSLKSTHAVQSIELNQNPSIGQGKGKSMKLIVQIAHLTAGHSLLRLHLDNNNIEDEGIRVLADAFTKDRFAPHLQILWLNKNCITDVGADVFGEALENSLNQLIEICLAR